MKDAKGHGSDKHTASMLAEGGGPKAVAAPIHPGAAGRSDGGKQVTILHQDGEYAVPNGKGHYFTNDKADAISTAQHIHGSGVTIKHRSKRWGPEMG